MGREGSKYGTEEYCKIKYVCMAGSDVDLPPEHLPRRDLWRADGVDALSGQHALSAPTCPPMRAPRRRAKPREGRRSSATNTPGNTTPVTFVVSPSRRSGWSTATSAPVRCTR